MSMKNIRARSAGETKKRPSPRPSVKPSAAPRKPFKAAPRKASTPRKPAVKKPKRPVFPPTPLDEMAGVLLVSVGVLATLLAVKPSWMGGLAPIGEGLQAWLGTGFVMAGAFIVLLGLEAFTPHQALALPQLLLAL